MSYFIDGVGIDWEDLRYQQERLRASPGVSCAEITFGGEVFALHRGGSPPYTFRLTNKAFAIGLSERMQPRAHVKFDSHLLWTQGFDGAIKRMDAIWTSLGAYRTRPEVVSRVDAAFDFAIGARDFQREDFVSQAVKDGAWRANQSDQSFQFGKGDVVCRVYDKSAEIEEESGKTWFHEIWGLREGVWRVEFQIRGERLKPFGIGSIDQLRAYLPSLVRELAKHHTSLRKPSNDSNRSRWPLHPLWQRVIASTDALVPPPEQPPPPLLVGTEYQLQRQLRSIYGHFKGLAATLSVKRPNDPLTWEELHSRLPHLLDLMHSPELWRADVAKKVRERELGL